MIEGLESRVDAQAEILLALKEAVDQLSDVTNEDTSSLESTIEKTVIPDELKDVIEQELDTESYTNSEYEVAIYGQKTNYEYKNEVEAEGASVSYSVETNEHEMLEAAQEANQEAKQAQMVKDVDMGRLFDEDRQHKMLNFKVAYSQSLSFLIYDGTIQIGGTSKNWLNS